MMVMGLVFPGMCLLLGANDGNHLTKRMTTSVDHLAMDPLYLSFSLFFCLSLSLVMRMCLAS